MNPDILSMLKPIETQDFLIQDHDNAVKSIIITLTPQVNQSRLYLKWHLRIFQDLHFNRLERIETIMYADELNDSIKSFEDMDQYFDKYLFHHIKYELYNRRDDDDLRILLENRHNYLLHTEDSKYNDQEITLDEVIDYFETPHEYLADHYMSLLDQETSIWINLYESIINQIR